MHSYIALTISQTFEIAARTCGRFCKSYGPISALGSPCFTPFKSTSLLGNLDKLSEPPILSGHLIPALDNLLTALFVVKYIEKDLQRIFKIVQEAQAPASASITLLKGL